MGRHDLVQGREKVWDGFVRLFHWTMVILFVAAFLTGEFRANETHLWLGYGIAILLSLRLVWGFIGSPYARFRSWFFPPSETLSYLRDSLKGHPRHYVGHNPLGALMVITLLLMLSLLVTTGLLIAAAIEFEGPLLAFASAMSDDRAYAIRALHEIVAVFTLFLISLHVLGALIASIQHRENLVWAMFTGFKRGRSSASDAVPERRQQ